MAGHCHSANIKHKKDRKDNARSQLFLKLRKQLEQLIKTEGISEKVLALARKNKFPKEKVLKIAEELKKTFKTVY